MTNTNSADEIAERAIAFDPDAIDILISRIEDLRAEVADAKERATFNARLADQRFREWADEAKEMTPKDIRYLGTLADIAAFQGNPAAARAIRGLLAEVENQGREIADWQERVAWVIEWVCDRVDLSDWSDEFVAGYERCAADVRSNLAALQSPTQAPLQEGGPTVGK